MVLAPALMGIVKQRKCMPHRLYLQKKKSKKNKVVDAKNKQCFNSVLLSKKLIFC